MLPHSLDLKYFLCVCECKNISRASELLGISQPSVSMAIKRLENIAGTSLLVRGKTGVDLTRAGEAFKARSEELLELWQAIFEEIKRSVDEVSGRYVLGAHVSVALMSLTFVIKQLMQMHPALELSISHGLSRMITDQVISFDIDFALVVNPAAHPDLVIKEINRDVVGFFVQRLGFDHNVLIYDPNLLQAQSLLKVIKAMGLKFKRTITSSSLEFIGRLAEKGVGVALMPERAARYVGGLSLWENHLPTFADRHCLIYRADAHRTKSSRIIAKDLTRLLIARNEVEGERMDFSVHQT